MKKFEYTHIVGFEDTNLVGNVYFSNFLKWQGRCREFFLKENCPEILGLINSNDLALITIHCSCDYIGELKAFDEVRIAMRLIEVKSNRVKIGFEYFRIVNASELLVATGVHEIGCFKRKGDGLEVIPVPASMIDSLEEYRINS